MMFKRTGLILSATVAITAFPFGKNQPNVDCNVDARMDCGFVGVTQDQCESKGCCWKPAANGSPNDTPWCFYAKGNEPKCWALATTTDAPFTAEQVKAFTGYFLDNINIQGSGAVVAAPDHNTPGGSYYYHWERDGALTMRTLFDTQSNTDSYMQSYVKWVLKVQNQQDPNSIDVRTEPKYTIPDGKPYTGGWCRPQTDGPALRASALIEYANSLMDAGKKDYVLANLWTSDDSKLNGGAIKYDLAWVASNWQQNGCDLWEEVQSNDFFWNRINFKRAMQLGAEFASKMGDSASANMYKQAASSIIDSLSSHWTGTFIQESDNRQQDGATFVALNDGYFEADGLYKPTSAEVAGTIKTLIDTFCTEYPINQADYKNNIPGILIGRYPGDTYAGGNPWVLTSGALATLFYRGASMVLNENGVSDTKAMPIWRSIFGLKNDETPAPLALSKLFAASADGVLQRIAVHIKDDGFHMDEQIDKNTGKQMSAKDLTWSYAEVIKAMHERSEYLKLYEKVASQSVSQII